MCEESGLLSVQAFVKKHQVDFLKNMRARSAFEASPLKFMMDLAVQCYSPMGKYLIEQDKLEGGPYTLFNRELRSKLQSPNVAPMIAAVSQS